MSKQSTGSNESVTNAMSNSSSAGTVTETCCSETLSSKAPFSTRLPIATKKSPRPSPETIQAAAKFEENGSWTVEISNWEAALLALADDRHPFYIKLLARVDAREALPVATIVQAIKRCRVLDPFYALSDHDSDVERDEEEAKCRCLLQSLDTFYTATDVAIDKERLEHIAANPSIRLESFYGHLDHESIVKLPRCNSLGLAIGSAADAAAVSALRPPQLPPVVLNVSVTASVAVEDLQVLPDVQCHHIYFPFLSDDRVGSVRPAIEALLPNLKVHTFEIPKCQLTSHGLEDLIEQLRGVVISYRVHIETSGTWQPGTKEKESFAVALYRAVGCAQVKWNEDRKIFPSNLSYKLWLREKKQGVCFFGAPVETSPNIMK